MTEESQPPPPGAFAIDLAARFYQVANAMVREADRHLAHRGPVTFVQGLVLVALSGAEPMQPHHVSERLGQQPQSLTSMFDRLERDGLLTRVRDLPDRRAIRLELTEEGASIASGLRESLASWFDGLFAVTDQAVLGEMLSNMQVKLDARPA